MQKIKRCIGGISPRTGLLIVYFLVMGIGATIFTRLANSLNAIFLLPAELILAAIAYRDGRLRRDAGMLFGCVLIAWALIASALNGALLDESRAITYLGLAGAWFFMLRLPTTDTRAQLCDQFSSVCAALLVPYLPFVLTALFSMFTGIKIHLPGDTYALGLDGSRIRVMANPNICGRMAVISILLAIYLFMHRKKLAWRIFSVVCVIANFLVVVHSQSRGCQIGLAVAGAAIGFHAAYARIGHKKWLRIAAGVLACAIAFMLVLGGIDLVFKADAKIISRVSGAEAVSSESHAEADGRFNLSGDSRAELWKAALNYWKTHPKALLLGINDSDPIQVICESQGLEDVLVHIHNALLDCVVLCGLPFLLIILAFLIWMIPKCWRAVTAGGSGAFIFVAIIVGLLTMSVSEVMLFCRLKVDNSIFMLACGYVIRLTDKKGIVSN